MKQLISPKRTGLSVGQILIILVCACACQKTVHLNLNNAGPQIVIQGEVTDTTGPYTVTINRTVNFYAENSFPPVSGASVKISDSEGHVDSLVETNPGVYSTQTLQGKPGNTYTLSVLSQDTLYTAVSTMPQPVKLDSITFNHKTGQGNKTIFAIPNFQDPAGIANYYEFLEYVNGVYLNKDIFVFDDRLSDGRYITRSLRNDSSRLAVGDWLEVKMLCIDKPVFDYYYELEQSGGRFNSAASPANPVSNISNGALGVFSAHTVRSLKTRVY